MRLLQSLGRGLVIALAALTTAAFLSIGVVLLSLESGESHGPLPPHQASKKASERLRSVVGVDLPSSAVVDRSMVNRGGFQGGGSEWYRISLESAAIRELDSESTRFCRSGRLGRSFEEPTVVDASYLIKGPEWWRLPRTSATHSLYSNEKIRFLICFDSENGHIFLYTNDD